MLSRIKLIILAVFSTMGAIFIALLSYRHGQKSGEKKIKKEVSRAEKIRQERQEKVDKIYNHAIKQAMDVSDDNAVDHFNRLFDDSNHPPKK